MERNNFLDPDILILGLLNFDTIIFFGHFGHYKIKK